VAKPNYSFEKRQRELAKKKKKEEKEKEKAGRRLAGEQGSDASAPAADDAIQAPVDPVAMGPSGS
jgi:hypothetical protein